jgi:hypothetical protein
MIDFEQVSALLVEAAELDDDVAMVVRNAEDNWIVRFEQVDIEIGCDVERERLVLVSTVGVPEPGRRMTVLEAMMAYNFLVIDTGGVRMAMTGTDGDIVQMVDIGLSGLTARDMAVALVNMAEKTQVWRAFIAAKGADVAAPPSLQETMTFQA